MRPILFERETEEGRPVRPLPLHRREPVISVKSPDGEEPEELEPPSRTVRLLSLLGKIGSALLGLALVLWLLQGWHPFGAILAFCGILGLVAVSGGRSDDD
ncbi:MULTISPECIES: hypothetical protein [Jonquetella]|uniref:Uncharacterized protein n=1 Tax=Jonquetella anthropi DSM 22815 TaxID=885272 RepID=H0UJB5_9BACT|nr:MULTISPECIES: hypothetical protein [Jonquetella]EEX49091.1 hypothetical protein GCWU000246_00177 [Jonquetella anthropi E3_33 E1]EHM13882.1 hypothetical protein JonanDRAFT_1520 [Jonquetella anthropi DSM 22815]ERL24213.1 hypothetical protein HMPREF1249_0822 [Jonquetella sp. BV3C21]